ncbi:MAG: hypothetical protein AABW46_03020 [Nanoarchaeota archaeon]
MTRGKILKSSRPHKLREKMDSIRWSFTLLHYARDGLHKGGSIGNYERIYRISYRVDDEVIALSALEFDTLCEVAQRKNRGEYLPFLMDEERHPIGSVGHIHGICLVEKLLPSGLVVPKDEDKDRYVLSCKARTGKYIAEIVESSQFND